MIRYILLVVGLLGLTVAIYMTLSFVPIMSGMAAKTMCSGIHVLGRSPESIKEKELSVFPGLASADFELTDSTVTASVLWSKGKAVFRKGLGCTLLAQRSATGVFVQNIEVPSPPFSQDTVAWPMGDRLDTARLTGVDYKKIEQAIDDTFQEPDPSKPQNTLAVVVLYRGQIVGERYAEGITPQSKLMGWSMTKSITNAMIGLLVRDGRLVVDKPAPVKEWPEGDPRKAITLNNLLQASSGLEWEESYFLPGDFHNMFIFSDDKGGYAATRELEKPPGTFWEYSSGTSNLLARIAKEELTERHYHRYLYNELFYKIGMHHTLVEPDASGTFVGSSYGYASARDWARFGLLFQQDGMWNGKRILPEGWVNYSRTPATTAPLGQYGAQFWLNAGAPGDTTKCYHPGLPHDEYGAEGFEGQYVFIIPSRDVVVVRLGVSHHTFDITGLTQKVLAALPR